MPNSIAHIRAGTVRPLAITTATRSDALPDLPSLGDFVSGYEVNTWFGVGAPTGTPAAIVDKLNQEINAALADPQDQGAACRAGRHAARRARPPNSRMLSADETEKWAKLIRARQASKPE